jgi:Tol biopolymer transport system component
VADIAGGTQLYLRPMDRFEARPMPGTEGAYNPFFSPDGRWIGFFTGNVMKKVSVFGGVPVALCEVINARGATWGPDDRIIFPQKAGYMLSWVSAAGGTPKVVADRRPNYRGPDILPGGKAALVSGIRVVFLDTGEEKVLGERGANPRYLSTGHIVFVRDERLHAVPFDLGELQVTGPPVPVLDGVRLQYTISSAGTVVYVPGVSGAKSTLVWVDRTGQIEHLEFPVEKYGTFQISPGGRKLAIQVVNYGNSNIWLYDLRSGFRSRLTLEGNNGIPIWTPPDGQWVTYRSDTKGIHNVFMKRADGSGEIRQLTYNTDSRRIIYPYSFSPDGETLALGISGDIFLLALDNKAEPKTFVESGFEEWGAIFSPDGLWIAYVSDEQGQYDVYVQPYPRTGQRWRISTEGGEEPVWSRNSNELFYRNGNKWLSVTYAATPTFIPDMPQVLFEGYYVNVAGWSYDVSLDGQRFLLLKKSQGVSTRTHLNVVTNWFEELKRNVPTNH